MTEQQIKEKVLALGFYKVYVKVNEFSIEISTLNNRKYLEWCNWYYIGKELYSIDGKTTTSKINKMEALFNV